MIWHINVYGCSNCLEPPATEHYFALFPFACDSALVEAATVAPHSTYTQLQSNNNVHELDMRLTEM